MNKQMKKDIQFLKGYFSLTQTAAFLGVTRQWAAEMINKGKIKPVFQIDGFYVIPERSVKKAKKTIDKKRGASDRSRES